MTRLLVLATRGCQKICRFSIFHRDENEIITHLHRQYCILLLLTSLQNTCHHSRPSAQHIRRSQNMNSFVWFSILMLQYVLPPVYSFVPFGLKSRHHKTHGEGLPWKTSATNGKAVPEKLPPMSKEEVMEILDSVPVYAVTEADQEGLVLLKEKDNPNDLAYFFFSPDTANEVFAPIRQKNENAKWAVTQYRLGLVWFELYKDPEPGIEYRFIPDGQNLGGARQLIEEQSKQLGSNAPSVFQKGYNQIPVFIDQFLRIQTPDGGEKFPLYLGIQDMITTCQQAADATSGKYEAAINVANLEDLITQMQSGCENDFRKAALIPPSSSAQTNKMQEESNDDGVDNSNGLPLSTPTASDLWDD